MTDRSALRRAFLDRAGWADARIAPIDGDASARRYWRLRRPSGARAMLMDAAPPGAGAAAASAEMAQVLARAGVAVPETYLLDPANGFLLQEDFGDADFPAILAWASPPADTLYRAAALALTRVQAARAPAHLARQSADRLTEDCRIAFSYFGAAALPDYRAAAVPREATEAALTQLRRAMAAACPSVLVHRDYHAGNLFWLPERRGTARVGMIDFQDAMIGHPAYDLVSVLLDARRDVPAPARKAALGAYLKRSGADASTFTAAFHALGLQRNLRILGVFARLGAELGKPGYMAHAPRVWRHLTQCLERLEDAALTDALMRALPGVATLDAACPR